LPGGFALSALRGHERPEHTGKQNGSHHPANRSVYDYKGYQPHPNRWAITKEKIEELDRQGRLYFPNDKAGRIRIKRYLDDSPGQIAQNFRTDISPIDSQAHEAAGYATQKPEALLERVIKTSSSVGELNADFFCGSGPSAVVAKKSGRRWIASDLGKFGIHTARMRMIATWRGAIRISRRECGEA
jgi:adenine-specific DNA-methyltransferase